MVEFSRVEYANTQTQEEENVIMTSHSYDRDPYGTQVTTQFAESPFTQVRSHSHSHPDDPRYKKGPSSKENNGDVAAYQMWTERQGSSIKFFIRVGGVTREYDVDGNLVTPNK